MRKKSLGKARKLSKVTKGKKEENFQKKVLTNGLLNDIIGKLSDERRDPEAATCTL